MDIFLVLCTYYMLLEFNSTEIIGYLTSLEEVVFHL